MPPECRDWQSNLPIRISEPTWESDGQADGRDIWGWMNEVNPDSGINAGNNVSITTGANGVLYMAVFVYVAPYFNVSLYKSTDFGMSWTYCTMYSVNGTCSFPSVAVDLSNNWVIVVYQRNIAGENDIVGFRYRNGSVEAFNIDTDSGSDIRPCITSEYSYGTGNRQYVTYEHIEFRQPGNALCPVKNQRIELVILA